MQSDIDAMLSWTTRSSYPSSGADDDGNSDDEIVFFGDEAEYESAEVDYENYYFEEEKKEDLPSGYSRDELYQKVVFVKSRKDADGQFIREKKELLWCLNNGCEEVEKGIWSDVWYFEYLYGKECGKTAWIDSQSRRLVKEQCGKARHIDNHTFCAMLKKKEKGNRAFSREQYKSALDNYIEAEHYLGGAGAGIYLVAAQREELVKVLSNQAECYLRMHKYEDAIIKSSAAIQLNKHHEKSLLRRAKAILQAKNKDNTVDSLMEAQAKEDLQVLISLDGQGTLEAEALLRGV
jgi:hypothetical protein